MSPTVPVTLEGSWMLHQMVRLRQGEWNRLPEEWRREALAEVGGLLSAGEGKSTAVYSLIGHKGDLLFLHLRPSAEELAELDGRMSRLALWEYADQTSSYLSVVELGLYESTQRMWRVFTEQGLKPDTEEWNRALGEELDRQRKAMAPRLNPAIPDYKFICFYPMDRARGEAKNWYQVPFAERARMMHEHGLVGRKYADVVKQIISGSIGLDDWEWAVDLFSDDPVWFKKLIYEMRFDEVSAVYARFGPFYVGRRLEAGDLEERFGVSVVTRSEELPVV